MIAEITDNKIQTVISSYQETERTIISGSDEHLDIILELQGDLNKMTFLTRKLVEEIETNFNSFSQETAKEAVVKIFPCFRIAYQVIGAIKRSAIYNSVKSCITELEAELEELKEFVSDLSRYKVQPNDRLLSLFNEED